MPSFQVLEFQDKHRRRLFAFYAEKVNPADVPRAAGRRTAQRVLGCWAAGLASGLLSLGLSHCFLFEAGHAAAQGPNPGLNFTLGRQHRSVIT